MSDKLEYFQLRSITTPFDLLDLANFLGSASNFRLVPKANYILCFAKHDEYAKRVYIGDYIIKGFNNEISVMSRITFENCFSGFKEMKRHE